MVSDFSIREKCLDTQSSFVVQAPAGSGKTEILIQRFLKLLAYHTQEPERILAITFTRKAAAEMRERIIAALKLAKEQEPCEPHKKITWQLAQKVLLEDAKRGWQLLENPNRIRATTIDALCAELTRQLPVTSGLGGTPDVSDTPTILYQEAAENLVLGLQESDSAWPSFFYILSIFDNRTETIIKLFASMLARRNAWAAEALHMRSSHQLREIIENNLAEVIETRLEALTSRLTPSLLSKWLQLVEYALSNLDEKSLKPLNELPLTDRLSAWRKMIALVMTSEGEFRKRVTKREGFPALSSLKGEEKVIAFHMRELLAELIEELSQSMDIEDLNSISQLPTPCYSDEHFKLIEALLDVLPLAIAHLELIFSKKSETDFTKIALLANKVLDRESVSDLLLRLDANLEHLLVDEVQDISLSQAELLKGLTQGFVANDGRTVFLVGDPMQSIYRFRQAEVGLFLNIQQEGRLGDLEIEPLYLTANFRSSEKIVSWVNQSFEAIFPKELSIETGSVPLKKAVAIKKANESDGVYWYLHANQPEKVAEILQKILDKNHNARCAVLFRTRTNVAYYAEALKKAGLPYIATDLELLSHKAYIQDLLALTEALFNPNDRLAWLALTRSPLIGINLKSLTEICEGATEGFIVDEILRHKDKVEPRQQHAIQVLKKALSEKGRLPWDILIAKVWKLLDGASAYNPYNQEDEKSFFEALRRHSRHGFFIKMDAFKDAIGSMFAKRDLSKASIELLTIHKSKGLEYDAVIIPELCRTSRNDSEPLLMLKQTLSSDWPLIAAKMPAKQDGIASFLMDEEKKCLLEEQKRLFYVAATRAKQELHLLFKEFKPKKGALLSFLKEITPKEYQLEVAEVSNDDELLTLEHKTERLSDPEVIFALSERDAENPVMDLNFPETNTELGKFLHWILEDITKKNLPQHCLLDDSLYRNCLDRASFYFMTEKEASKPLSRLLKNLSVEKRYDWLINKNYNESYIEAAFLNQTNRKLERLVVDRAFIDVNQAWVIDYKMSEPKEGEDLESFLLRELNQYQAQLEKYAVIFQNKGLSIHFALYFPLVPTWKEWSARSL